MIEIPFTDQMQALPDQWGNPGIIAAGAAVSFSIIALDKAKQRWQNNIRSDDGGIPLADPEIATTNDSVIESTNRIERASVYAALGMVMFAALNYAGPSVEKGRGHDGVTVVIDASNRADVADMADGKSRLIDSVDGAIRAAQSRGVGMSFMLSGTTASIVATTNGRNIDPRAIYGDINNELAKNSYRNGESIASGVAQSQALGSDGSKNKTIILSANPGAASETAKISAVAKQSGNVYAIVSGVNEGVYKVAGTELKSSTDAKGFTSLLGEDKVKTANSADQVQHEIEQIIDETLPQKESQRYTLFGNAAIAFALTGGLIALKRRGSGLITTRKRE